MGVRLKQRFDRAALPLAASAAWKKSSNCHFDRQTEFKGEQRFGKRQLHAALGPCPGHGSGVHDLPSNFAE